MELQLAFDVINKERALEIARELDGIVDIIEMGTPFSFVNPISVVREFKDARPIRVFSLISKSWTAVMAGQRLLMSGRRCDYRFRTYLGRYHQTGD